jgi:predicted transcriptional regulator
MSEEKTVDNLTPTELLRLTVDVTVAFLENNTVPVAQVPELMSTVHQSIQKLNSNDAEAENAPLKPAVSIRKSITDDYLICLEDGKRLKMLKRHLRTAYNMTPEEYRAKWRLPASYPMVAPAYAAQRSVFAKKIGLGKGSNKRGGKAS